MKWYKGHQTARVFMGMSSWVNGQNIKNADQILNILHVYPNTTTTVAPKATIQHISGQTH